MKAGNDDVCHIYGQLVKHACLMVIVVYLSEERWRTRMTEKVGIVIVIVILRN